MPPATPFVIFDCDGVLVDSEPHSCAALRAAIHTVTGLDIPHKYPHDYYPVFGFSVHSCLEYYKERFGKDWDVEAILEKVVEEKEAEYQRLAKGRLQTFPGFAEFLARARDAGCSFGIGSSGAMSKILFNLEEVRACLHESAFSGGIAPENSSYSNVSCLSRGGSLGGDSGGV
mmetsp:Transcript_27352/g.68631  ORF Transcript_27352/g.68631 Transcript_27352/m.68631 type:complete len:173 (-) Transcript_27352:603-1121(-)